MEESDRNTLPTIAFALVDDRVLKRLPHAGDIMHYASTIKGMRRLLTVAEREVAKFGLEFNPNKCVTM